MKFTKIIGGALGICAISFGTIAQDETLQNEEGFNVLPEQGEYAIGFNAVPIFNWIGNSFNANTNNTYAGSNKFVSNLGNNVLFGKYMLEEKIAIRAHLRVGVFNNSQDNFVIDDIANSPNEFVMDNQVINEQTYTLGAGYEYRRGKGRLQGIYGGDIFFMFNKYSESYEYGNQYGQLNQAPTTTTNFNTGNAQPQGERLVDFNQGGTFGVGVRPFVGVEYFFASKMSIGGEFGWNVMFANTSDGSTVSEYYDPVSEEVTQNTIDAAGARSWNLDTDNFNGAIFLMFYF
ncbi:MAG: hypothetical protein WED10_11620 [Brumimicrobium sp.]